MGIQALHRGGMRALVTEDMAQLAMKFVRLGSPTFTGTDPLADPRDFLEETEKTTTLLGVKDHRVVILAAYQLKDVAELWFKGVRAALAVSFETLKKDTMSVSEYNIMFEKFSRYAPHLIPTDDDKIDHFARGLILSVRKEADSGRRNTTYADFVNLAMDFERIQQEEKVNREQNKKAHTFGTFSAVPSLGEGQNSGGPSRPP
ncbi:uncharacterized protein [Nicotiana tomentosiformis]|uniref:uncharacterized protein n=1 Tax=Nicotiana tomentosiformis TaxID=4098 RepID=UPI00051BDE6A|nr:uncharacterized protein LOC117280187 [Nicotiana tomentosiformis]